MKWMLRFPVGLVRRLLVSIESWLSRIAMRKVQKIGLPEVVDAMNERRNLVGDKFYTDGICIWHRGYSFPIAVWATLSMFDGVENPSLMEEDVIFVLDPSLVRDLSSDRRLQAELILASSYLRSSFEYDGQLSPDGMQRLQESLGDTDSFEVERTLGGQQIDSQSLN